MGILDIFRKKRRVLSRRPATGVFEEVKELKRKPPEPTQGLPETETDEEWAFRELAIEQEQLKPHSFDVEEPQIEVKGDASVIEPTTLDPLTQSKRAKDTELLENELVEQSVVHKQVTPVRKSYEKRRFVEIRNKILESLETFPKTTTEASKDIHCHYLTAKRHLEYLQDLGVVRKARFKLRGDEQDLWMKT